MRLVRGQPHIFDETYLKSSALSQAMANASTQTCAGDRVIALAGGEHSGLLSDFQPTTPAELMAEINLFAMVLNDLEGQLRRLLSSQHSSSCKAPSSSSTS